MKYVSYLLSNAGNLFHWKVKKLSGMTITCMDLMNFLYFLQIHDELLVLLVDHPELYSTPFQISFF
jgi:hypothetical protein